MSRDDVCAAGICIKRFTFGEALDIDESLADAKYDGVIGLNEPTSV